MLRAGLLNHAASDSSAGQGARYYGTPLRFVNYGLAAYWRSSKGVTLNGTDVSGLASQVPGGLDLAQATGAIQPLGTGAPTYGGAPLQSIQFVQANNDQLARANTDLIGTGDKTFFSVQRIRTSTTSLQMILSNESPGTTAGMGIGLSNVGNLRALHDAAVANDTDGAVGTSAPEVWVAVKPSGAVGQLWVNGAVAIAASNAGDSAPGGTGLLALGDIGGTWLGADMDWLESGVFTKAVPTHVVTRMTSYARATYAF